MGKIELFKAVDDFHQDKKVVGILVWENGGVEHCALIKTIDNLLDRPNKNYHKYYYCSSCTYWFSSKIKYNNYTCSHSFKPEIVCPMMKHVPFINEHKRQRKVF